MAVTLNLLRLRYKFIFCTRQTTAHSSPCLSWESLPTDKTSFCVGYHSQINTIKNTITNAIVFFMGRVMGIEPTNIGTTIRGLNRLATPAISSLTLKQTNLFFNYHFIFYLQYYKNAHILD